MSIEEDKGGLTPKPDLIERYQQRGLIRRLRSFRLLIPAAVVYPPILIDSIASTIDPSHADSSRAAAEILIMFGPMIPTMFATKSIVDFIWDEKGRKEQIEKLLDPSKQKYGTQTYGYPLNSVLHLPPIGGKIPLSTDGKLDTFYTPSLLAEEQVDYLNQIRQEHKSGGAYVHQFTVQGRLPDMFKYSAIALIANSPYSADWSTPFFSAPWGSIAPLIHDGGNWNRVHNPVWVEVDGRTDFIQRIMLIEQPNLEDLERLSPEQRVKLPFDTLVKARYEQIERDRLMLETKFYQRSALACHAKVGSIPREVDRETKKALAVNWDNFVSEMDQLLADYDVQGVAKVRWFTRSVRLTNFGLRKEASYPPIREQLIRLEDIKAQNPQMRADVASLMGKITDNVDRAICLAA